MRRILFPLAGLLVVAAIVAWLVDMPGDVLINWRDFEVSTSAAFMTGLVGITIIFSIAVFEAIRGLRAAPGKMRDRRQKRRESLGLEALTDGLLAIASGNGAAAKRHASTAEQHLERPALTLLLNAQTAQLNNDHEAAAAHFQEMIKDQRTALLGYRGLIAKATRDSDPDEALKLARAAEAGAEKGADVDWLNALLFDLETRALNWAGAEQVLEKSLKAKQIDANEHKRSRALIKHAAGQEASRTGNTSEALKAAEAAHKDLPQFQPNVALLASLLHMTDKKRRARRLLLDAWAAAPHPDLARVFSDLESLESPAAWLKRSGDLTARNPEHVESYLVTAEAALKAQAWDQAREAIEAAYAISVEARVCSARAELEERADGNEVAAREWRYRAEAASAGPGWICDSCDQRHDAWDLHCNDCGSFGTLRWRDPIQVLAAAGMAGMSEIVTLSDSDLTDMPHTLVNSAEEATPLPEDD